MAAAPTPNNELLIQLSGERTNTELSKATLKIPAELAAILGDDANELAQALQSDPALQKELGGINLDIAGNTGSNSPLEADQIKEVLNKKVKMIFDGLYLENHHQERIMRKLLNAVIAVVEKKQVYVDERAVRDEQNLADKSLAKLKKQKTNLSDLLKENLNTVTLQDFPDKLIAALVSEHPLLVNAVGYNEFIAYIKDEALKLDPDPTKFLGKVTQNQLRPLYNQIQTKLEELLNQTQNANVTDAEKSKFIGDATREGFQGKEIVAGAEAKVDRIVDIEKTFGSATALLEFDAQVKAEFAKPGAKEDKYAFVAEVYAKVEEVTGDLKEKLIKALEIIVARELFKLRNEYNPLLTAHFKVEQLVDLDAQQLDDILSPMYIAGLPTPENKIQPFNNLVREIRSRMIAALRTYRDELDGAKDGKLNVNKLTRTQKKKAEQINILLSTIKDINKPYKLVPLKQKELLGLKNQNPEKIAQNFFEARLQAYYMLREKLTQERAGLVGRDQIWADQAYDDNDDLEASEVSKTDSLSTRKAEIESQLEKLDKDIEAARRQCRAVAEIIEQVYSAKNQIKNLERSVKTGTMARRFTTWMAGENEKTKITVRERGIPVAGGIAGGLAVAAAGPLGILVAAGIAGAGAYKHIQLQEQNRLAKLALQEEKLAQQAAYNKARDVALRGDGQKEGLIKQAERQAKMQHAIEDLVGSFNRYMDKGLNKADPAEQLKYLDAIWEGFAQRVQIKEEGEEITSPELVKLDTVQDIAADFANEYHNDFVKGNNNLNNRVQDNIKKKQEKQEFKRFGFFAWINGMMGRPNQALMPARGAA